MLAEGFGTIRGQEVGSADVSGSNLIGLFGCRFIILRIVLECGNFSRDVWRWIQCRAYIMPVTLRCLES